MEQHVLLVTFDVPFALYKVGHKSLYPRKCSFFVSGEE